MSYIAKPGLICRLIIESIFLLVIFGWYIPSIKKINSSIKGLGPILGMSYDNGRPWWLLFWGFVLIILLLIFMFLSFKWAWRNQEWPNVGLTICILLVNIWSFTQVWDAINIPIIQYTLTIIFGGGIIVGAVAQKG